MRIVGIRQFRQQTATLLQDMQRRKEALLLTRHGQPVGVVLPVDGEVGEDPDTGLPSALAAGVG